MSEFQFRDPWFLLIGLAAVPVLFWTLRSKAAIGYSNVALFSDLPVTWRVRFRMLPPVFTAVSFLLLAIALARPQTPDETARISREGIGIMLVIDRSGSMDARDLEEEFLNVNRLAVVKQVIRYFVTGESDDSDLAKLESAREMRASKSGRPDDMIGVVTFAGFADSVCPLTLDHGNLLATIDEIKLADRSEGGTAIGEGLGLAVERLKQSEVESKVVILLTDGVNNSGELDPLTAGDLASSEDIKVYCIGAGTNGYAPFPVTNPITGSTELRAIPVEIDEDVLKAIAEKTGGKYFRATDKSSLKSIYDEIDQLERTEVSEFRYLNYEEHYYPFALSAVLMLSAAWLLRQSVFRTLPE